MSAMGTHRGVAAADRLCEACVDLLAVDAAAISLVFDGAHTGTVGASSARARMFDELQFVIGEGPCLETVTMRAPVLVVDLDDPADTRWPGYRPAMLAHDIRAIFAMPVLIAGEYLGAIDLFRAQPGVLSHDQLAGALVAAELAELPVLDLLDEDVQLASTGPEGSVWADLATITRTEVSQATGMLVAQLDIEPAEALARLRAHAYAEGRPASRGRQGHPGAAAASGPRDDAAPGAHPRGREHA